MNWFDIFRSLRPKTKPFSAWQIELTTECPLRCRMCIREGCEGWHNAYMNINDFRKLLPYLKETETVILEGWGESLLHKDLIEIISMAKAEGPEVGFVTSGRVLNRNYISGLVKSGVDFIGFSLSGATPETHNSIRVNSEFRSLIEHIRTFNEIKKDRKSSTPRLHIVYLMVKNNISEIPYLLRLAKEIGVEEVVLINLIFVTNEWQESQRVFRCDNNQHPHPNLPPSRGREKLEVTPQSRRKSDALSPLDKSEATINPPSPCGRGLGGGVVEQSWDYEEILKDADTKAKELKIKLRRPSLSPVDVPVCAENPLRNLYISVDGEVSPCVYLYPPVPSPFKRIFCGNEFYLERVSFGNIFRKPFPAIWNSRRYTEFRECFVLRKKKTDDMRLSIYDIERLRRFEITPLPEPPEQCKTCHKIFGV